MNKGKEVAGDTGVRGMSQTNDGGLGIMDSKGERCLRCRGRIRHSPYPMAHGTPGHPIPYRTAYPPFEARLSP